MTNRRKIVTVRQMTDAFANENKAKLTDDISADDKRNTIKKLL